MVASRCGHTAPPRARSARGHVVEIAKATQTLLIVDSGVVKRIYNASTGSNQRYFQGGNGHIATTPSGTFRAFRRVNAWDSGSLGSLYRPQYFNGYTSVPSTAASHGCSRVSLRAMDNLWDVGGIRVGTSVLLY